MNQRRARRLALTNAGWHLARRGRNHEIWHCPCGEHMATVSYGHRKSAPHAMRNLAADIRRCPA